MTDVDAGAAPSPEDATGTAPQGPQLRILAQFIRDLSFENPRAPDVLRALAARQIDKVPAHVALAFKYGEAASQGVMADELRDEIRAKWGEQGLIELAFTIATARFYPGLKRALGYGHICERVVVEDRVTMTAKAA